MLILLITGISYAQIGVGTTTPDLSSAFDVTSTTQGFVAPRLSTSQRDAIASPIEGLMIFNTTTHCYEWFQGKIWFNACVDSDIVVGGAGKKWYPWNVGALKPADSPTDYTSYGSLYQWGRGSDGHQLIVWTSPTAGTIVNGNTNVLSATDTPANSLFIVNDAGFDADWRSTQNNNLWQGYAGINNPCEPGFRIPTAAEWQAELIASNISDLITSFNSILRLTAAGYRHQSSTVDLMDTGVAGFYWSSNVSATNLGAHYASFTSFSASGDTSTWGRGGGFSVRCIKD